MLLITLDLIIAYLIGSVCSAVIVSRIFGLPDPRIEGSKNPGATNVLRLAGKKYAVIVLLADMLKGFLPVLLAHAISASPTVLGFTCFAAVLGHMYPLFFGFKGGKGVATAIGAMFGFQLYLGVLVAATWLIVANLTRYSSLASILATLFAPFFSIVVIENMDAFTPLLLIAIFILYKHHENVTRLVAGEEPKIQFKKVKKSK
jgi:glycerol-3-phosphate acyltransferase PlsY